MKKLLLAVAVVGIFGNPASAALVVFDDFNINEGHFNQNPTFSGSTTGIATTSTAVRITTDSFEGAGNEQLVFNDDATAGGASRVRFLSGSGTPANNLSFTTSGLVDGWIGLALKTTSPGWTAQMWIEGPENNGSIPKTIASDGEWHIYEWDLDNQMGSADGWGAVAGIVAGDADVQNGTYTIDSVLFRHTATPATATIFMDIVARNTDGTLSSVFVAVPEAGSFAAMGLVGVLSAGAVWFKKRRAAQVST